MTLLLAAFLSNASRSLASTSSISMVGRSFVVPPVHPLYDACWGVVLPMSLVFALLASSSPSSSPSPIMTDTSTTKKEAAADTAIATTRAAVLGMATPFVAGCAGSVIGCVASHLVVGVPCYRSRATSAVLAGCLAASYVGGTVNFLYVFILCCS